MIPETITAPFRWWAKHPWMVFCCTIPIIYIIRSLLGVFAPSAFVTLLSATIMILSFSRGVFVTWQRSGIRAAFRWWAKHPWIVFWGTIPITYLLFALYQPSVFVSRTILLLSTIVWILSFSRGVFVTWQRAGIIAVLIDVALPLIVVGYLAAIAIPQYAFSRRRGYDGMVKAYVRSAANAEEAYYKVNGTYTANIGNLKGFNQRDNVTIAVEVTATTFVITGTKMKGCKAGTGTWFISSTTGKIDGTPCSR